MEIVGPRYHFYILLFLLCVTPSIIKAQDKLVNFTDSIAKKLQAEAVDTIISFVPRRSIHRDDENLKGIGLCTITSDRYLLYSRNGKTYLVRTIDGWQDDQNHKSVRSMYQSAPLEIYNDSSLSKI